MLLSLSFYANFSNKMHSSLTFYKEVWKAPGIVHSDAGKHIKHAVSLLAFAETKNKICPSLFEQQSSPDIMILLHDL